MVREGVEELWVGGIKVVESAVVYIQYLSLPYIVKLNTFQNYFHAVNIVMNIV